MGLFKNEAVAKDSPFRSGALNQRLHSALGHQTPEECEQAYYARESGSLPDDAANKTAA
ncbi:hypothetical protein SAMN04487914_13931 [Arthrobacter sp. ok909]|nr:hypothetical protein SAMN04487914_13931 [Arthrobacter sp. ok909]